MNSFWKFTSSELQNCQTFQLFISFPQIVQRNPGIVSQNVYFQISNLLQKFTSQPMLKANFHLIASRGMLFISTAPYLQLCKLSDCENRPTLM